MIPQILMIALLVFSSSSAYAEEFSRNLNETVKINDNENFSTILIKPQNVEQTMKDMKINEFKKIVNDSVSEIAVSDYTRAALETYTVLVATIIGGLIGFLGSLGIELIKKSAATTKIRELCLKDLIRLERNLKNNYVVCHELTTNRHERHHFIHGINTIPDLENLQNLGTSQQFNFWSTIISSTYLIQLKSDEIRNLQMSFDLTMKYNRYIEHMINGIPTHDLPYVVRGAKQTLAHQIFDLHNVVGAEVILIDLCCGLLSMHQVLHDTVVNTIQIISVENKSDSLLYRILRYIGNNGKSNTNDNSEISLLNNDSL